MINVFTLLRWDVKWFNFFSPHCWTNNVRQFDPSLRANFQRALFEDFVALQEKGDKRFKVALFSENVCRRRLGVVQNREIRAAIYSPRLRPCGSVQGIERVI